MKYLKENVKKFLNQKTVNIITLGGLGLIALSTSTIFAAPGLFLLKLSLILYDFNKFKLLL